MMSKSTYISQSIFFLLTTTLSFAQVTSSAVPILAQPGEYQIIDRSRIETAVIDWSTFSQKQDQEVYNKAADESYAAYVDFYGKCEGENCTGFQALRQIYIETVLTKKGEAAVPADVLASAIADYLQKRDLFMQKIAAVEVAQEVWSGLSQDSVEGGDNQKLLYQKGSVNLKALASTYREAISKVDSQASALTYRYKSNMGVLETQAGLGLEIPTAFETPESLKAKNADFQNKIRLSSQEVNTIGLMSIELGRHMLNFFDTNAKRLYWYNDLQEKDKQEWIESVETKARILKWIRSVYCMRLGVPALDIPSPTAFNLDYLKRGVSGFRIVQKAETNEDNIRKTLSRFDQLFTSMQSQSGEFNSEGGVMGFLNRVNSTFTWHNETHAFMNIMHILRDNMVDELDLAQNSVSGCDKVRERYYAKYETLKDEQFLRTVSGYLEGLNFGADGDALQKAFSDAGQIITSKGAYMRDFQKFIKSHPSVTLIQQTLKNADDLK